MKHQHSIAIFCLLLSMVVCSEAISKKADKGKPTIISIRVFHFGTTEQEKILDNYLEHALLPFLHKHKFAPVGVFKPVTNDTAADKRIYIIMNSVSVEKLIESNAMLLKDTSYTNAVPEYWSAAFDHPPFSRYENILIQAFPMAKQLLLPNLHSPKADHIYELRSYEGPTDALFRSKVKMFNEGGEVGLFKRLDFNAVFYGEVISGCRMPNLMYMTSFENKEERDTHWKAFGNDPEWKQLSAMPEYQHNVSKIDIMLMRATPYSDY